MKTTRTNHGAEIPLLPIDPPSTHWNAPRRTFDSVEQAVEYCMAEDVPHYALADIVKYNIEMDEIGFCIELLKAFPDGPIPERLP